MCENEAATQDCAFCLGRAAGHRGEPAASNPYPQLAAEAESHDAYETNHGLWETGRTIGASE